MGSGRGASPRREPSALICAGLWSRAEAMVASREARMERSVSVEYGTAGSGFAMSAAICSRIISAWMPVVQNRLGQKRGALSIGAEEDALREEKQQPSRRHGQGGHEQPAGRFFAALENRAPPHRNSREHGGEPKAGLQVWQDQRYKQRRRAKPEGGARIPLPTFQAREKAGQQKEGRAPQRKGHRTSGRMRNSNCTGCGEKRKTDNIPIPKAS